MKKLVAAISSVLALVPASRSLAVAGYGIDYGPPVATLNRVTISLTPAGAATYELSGHSDIGPDRFIFAGAGAYDPATHQTSERLREPGGNQIESIASCPSDPWQTATPCTNVKISSKGYQSAAMAYLTNLLAPLSAQYLDPGSRQMLKTEYKRALDAQRAAAKTGAMIRGAGGSVGAAAGGGGSSVLKVPAATQYPAYGAAYEPGPVPVLKVGSVPASVPVLVHNESSQTWPANGPFQLSYHWLQGGVEVVHEGWRTPLPATAAPGAKIPVTARVVPPPKAGSWTLRWDMVQGSTWFSQKGVATKDEAVTVNP